ncbi:MAG TPA: c-type cytochrome [Acidimicrobiales bacterium]
MDSSSLATVLAASTVTTVGAVIAAIVGIGAIVFIYANIRSARPEVGSEIELAPNRKPYLDDDELETTKLNRTLRWAFILLVLIAVGLPAYWLREPGRQSGAVEGYQNTFAARGAERYSEGSQCENCHGPEGSGGIAPYTILDADNQFVASVQWRAPALNTVLLRFTRDEVEYIINYGRPFSPMVGWGSEVNKGPLDEQQIQNLIDYFETIQLSPEESQRQVATELATQLGLLEEGESDEAAIDAAIEQIDYDDPQVGQILFNLGRENGFAGGAYACGRCHTRGWSIVTDDMEPADADVSEYVGYPDGAGALGPNLTGGIVPRQFASTEDLAEFISTGSADGEPYGRNGIGSGKMPSFGDNPNTEEVEGDGMLTPDMVAAIARYVETLPPAEATSNAPEGGSE